MCNLKSVTLAASFLLSHHTSRILIAFGLFFGLCPSTYAEGSGAPGSLAEIAPVLKCIDVGSNSYYSLTVQVREDAAFSGSQELWSSNSVVGYTIYGSTNLTDWFQDVTEVTPAETNGLPVLHSGWIYRTFRLNTPMSSESQSFLKYRTSRALQETYASLATPPEGGMEVAQGNFFSRLLNQDVPYRIFSPEDLNWQGGLPTWNAGKGVWNPRGVSMVIYTLNLETPAPRPSSTSDREIIEDLIERGYLVTAVDFTGATVTNQEAWAEDLSALFYVFGAKDTIEPSYTTNRLDFLGLPGIYEGTAITNFFINGVTVPIHRCRTYALPPGYTVEYFHAINEDFGVFPSQPVLFMDIIYPMPGKETRKLPVVLAQSATGGKGDDVMNSSGIFLSSWLFNGYAFAYTCNVQNDPEHADKYPMVQATRYLRGNKDAFSLNGIVGTTGISKSSTRTWWEGYFQGSEPVIAGDAFPEESSEVSINFPSCSHTLKDSTILSNLSEDSPALVLVWGPLNNQGTDDGSKVERAKNAYMNNGLQDKLFYRRVEEAGHEYPAYILNDVMEFWDSFCK